ncbi:TlpA disulfide reductase family protein [Plantactinospora sp. KLBMP9567]|uniref:TlpA family protein disulfide reductase n=1 Tax=Plantactinospora sp. KLBMP9567 TaxID=3085900 RepID=UPI002980ED15|nr:TlpA disulfide reductase family protein [Plantactinospora sp. KLBMP9567]MDW5326953.1 TlpA disulfide reductase family protein [Plantactinospora sp. KLBMP9567]
MPFVIAAVVLLGALCMVNLLLTFGILRRLREQTAELSRLSGALPPGMPAPEELVGTPVPAFAATAIDGTPVTRDSLMGRPGLVGFFSAGCAPCHEQAPVFAKWLAEQGDDATAAVAVITDSGPEAVEMATSLSGKATVVVEPDAFTVSQAFGVRGFPTFLRVDAGGVIAGADATVRGVVAQAAATS